MSSVGSVQTAELAQFLDIYLAASRQRIATLASERDSLEVKGGVYTDLKAKLDALRSVARELAQSGESSIFAAKSASSTSPAVLSATAGAGALAISHIVHVNQLARSHQVVSDRTTSSGTDIASSFAGTNSFTITVAGEDHDISVAIDAGDTNEEALAKIAAAVNDTADLPAAASKIEDTSTTAKLSIFSTETGLTNKMTFTDTDGLLTALGITTESGATDTQGGYIYADEELDALLTVDGINITHSSNSITGVLPGVTLELHGAQEPADADVTLAVAVDTETITAKVEEFLTSFNEAYAYLKSKVAVDRNTYARGDLAGEFSYVNLWQNMRSQVVETVSSLEGSVFSALSQIGINSSSLGSFSVSDAEEFEEALANELETVEQLFNAADGVAARLADLLEGYTSAAGSIHFSQDMLDTRVDSLNDRIERLESLQELEREKLVRQFGALQEATYMQQLTLSMLNSFMNY